MKNLSMQHTPSQAIALDQWQNCQLLSHTLLPKHYQELLTDNDSLTKKLRNITNGTIQHRLYFADWSKPDADECQPLNIKPDEKVWLREIEWINNQQLWVYARAVIPETSLTDETAQLTELGNRSVGDLLFSDPNLTRNAFEICRIQANHSYYDRACSERALTPSELWARRSVFSFYGKPLLVMEMFFPEIFEYLAQQGQRT